MRQDVGHDALMLMQTAEECRALVRRRAWVAAGAAAVPVPFMDIAIDIGLLMLLIPEISRRFGLDMQDLSTMAPTRRERIWQKARTQGAQFVGLVVTRELIRRSFQGYWVRLISQQLAKYVPLGGQLAAAALGYFVCREIAYRHIDDCLAVALSLLDQPGTST